jgi:hypothetical protein
VRDPRIGATTRPTRRADHHPSPFSPPAVGGARPFPRLPRLFFPIPTFDGPRERPSARAPPLLTLRALSLTPPPLSFVVRSSLTLPPPPSPPPPSRPAAFAALFFSPASRDDATGSSPSPSLRPSVSGSRRGSASRP